MTIRLGLLEEACRTARLALRDDEHLVLKMTIRDMGFFVFGLDQEFKRIPEGPITQ